MNKAFSGSLLEKIYKFSWVLFLVFLPVTSFPYFPPALGGDALVRPLSLYPLIVLMVLVTLPRLFKQPAPRTITALLPFTFAALAGSLIAMLRGIDPTQGVPVVERLLRAFITLGVGGAIYLTVSLVPRTPEDLRAALRWIYAGFSVALLWGSVQAYYIVNFSPAYFQWVKNIQKYISVRRLLNVRISGMTYEPNWFAEQITFLLLPWLLASILTGYSVFRWRWRWLTVEWLLLGWSLLVLPFTFSRAGLIVLFALIVVGLLFFRPLSPPLHGRFSRLPSGWSRRMLEASTAVLLMVGLVYAAGANNAFFSRIWGYWTEAKKPTLAGYFDYLGFGARIIYAEAAYNTYQAYPLLGIGIGNYAYYFNEMLPDEPLAPMPEVLRIVTPDAGRERMITSKNLYLRLLSETGWIGTAAFLAFVVAILGCALFLWLAKDKEQRYWGIAGLLGMVSFSLGATTFDSFAIPNMWVVFGLITAAAWVYRRTSPAPPPGAVRSESRELDEGALNQQIGEKYLEP